MGPEAAHEKLQRAQDLLRHSLPSGDVGEIFDRALAALIKEVEKERFALTGRPRTTDNPPAAKRGRRYIPAAVRRIVWTRDEGQCTFRSGSRRCESRSQLEYHHVIPWEVGGPTTPENLELRCRAHNNYEADLYFGPLRRAHEAHLDTSALASMARTFRFADSVRAESPPGGA